MLLIFCYCFVLVFFFIHRQGDKRRMERAELNSADGDTAEVHDQFYRDHKLLLVLFRGLAVMPITRSSPGNSRQVDVVVFALTTCTIL